MTTPTRTTLPILGVEVTPRDSRELLAEISEAIRGGRRLTVAGQNLHSAYLTLTDESFLQFYREAEVVLIDGAPLLALASLPGRGGDAARPGAGRRLGSTDWLEGLASCRPVRRVLLLGGSPAANAAALDHFRSLPGETAWHGVAADPWSAERLDAVVAGISETAPDVVAIGMGMPLQERIAAELRRRTEVPVIATVGGALDQLGGTQSLAPRWLGRWGLEWLWRLASDPRRLAGRYLVEPVRLAALLMMRRNAR